MSGPQIVDASSSSNAAGYPAAVSTLVPSLTAGDLIIVCIGIEGASSFPTISGVSANGCGTFVQRVAYSDIDGDFEYGYQRTEVWWAPINSSGTNILCTATVSGDVYDDAAISTIGVSGANNDAPWDTNGSLPGLFGDMTDDYSVTVSTTTADDLILVLYGSTTDNPDSNAPFTNQCNSSTGANVNAESSGINSYSASGTLSNDDLTPILDVNQLTAFVDAIIPFQLVTANTAAFFTLF